MSEIENTPPSLRVRAARLISAILKRILPRNNWGDFIFGLCVFRYSQGRFPQVFSPRGYSDLLFKMRTDGTLLDPLRQFVSDKEFVKHFVGAVVGWEHTVKTYKVLHSPNEVDDLELERIPCVLKPTHACGPVMFVTKDEPILDREQLKSWFKIDYYKESREINYKYLRPKVIVEEFFSEDGQTVPNDYKVFCFNGIPKFIQVDSDRYSGHYQHFYDLAWNRLKFTAGFFARPKDDPKPQMLDDMLDIAAQVSRPFPFVRVDMYSTDTEVKVGELTNCPHGSVRKLEPPETEYLLGGYFGEYLGNSR